jgi:hypothetical protein
MFAEVGMIRNTFAVALIFFASRAIGAPPFEEEFPPTTATVSVTVKVGDKVTVGGPKATNFLPNTPMDVYVVPHRVWRDGAPLAANAVHRGRVRSDAKGTIPLTQLWVPDKAGVYDIVIDYDGDGKFSYALDALSAIDVREK